MVMICHTVKGKGVSFMENVMEWHAITDEVYARSSGELKQTLITLSARARYGGV